MKGVIKRLKGIQRKILFGMMSYWDKKEGLCVNPFYKQTEKSIKSNREFAKEIYPKVFKHFLGAWFNRYGNFDGFCSDKRVASLII